MHRPGGNATDLIWRALASSNGISSWTPLKPQHSNSNRLANQLWCIDFLTPPTPFIIPHRLLAFFEFLMPLKNQCSIQCKMVEKQSEACPYVFLWHFFAKFKTEFYLHIVLLKCQIAFLEVHQLWQSGFSRVYFQIVAVAVFILNLKS